MRRVVVACVAGVNAIPTPPRVTIPRAFLVLHPKSRTRTNAGGPQTPGPHPPPLMSFLVRLLRPVPIAGWSASILLLLPRLVCGYLLTTEFGAPKFGLPWSPADHNLRLFEVAFCFPNDVAACGGLFAVFPRFLAWMGAFDEGVGRVALLLELCVRPFAVLIACTMVVAMFFQQWRGGLWNMLPALGFAWVMLDTMVPGAGPISLDAFLSRRWDK